MLGAPPLSLWLPYSVYRDTHRQHHATRHLTDPAHDPEAASPELDRWGVFGRLLLGPPLTIGKFLGRELGSAFIHDSSRRHAWMVHLLSVAPVIAWLVVIADFPLWKYLLAFVYPGTSLTLLRSLAEHRRDVAPERRTTVIEAGLFFRLLFLNNNLHAVHHANPRAAWFELPALWARERESFASQRRDLIHAGYRDVLRKRLPCERRP